MPLVCKAITNDPDITRKAKEEQWKHLILDPLRGLKEPAPKALVVVIDALDECDGEPDIQLILRLLFQARILPSAWLKVFVTSRPETPIRKSFHDESVIRHEPLRLGDIFRGEVDHDIEIYLRKELADFKVESWQLQQLIRKAGGLFIWATTACRFIKEGPLLKDKRLALVLGSAKPGKNPEAGLDEIYTSVLSASIRGDYDEEEYEVVFERFRSVVGAIVLLFNPLSTEALSQLLGMDVEVTSMILQDLHSVLHIPHDRTHPISVLHLSFRDFLVSKTRCQDSRLRVDERQGHRNLLSDCLDCMSKVLKEDVCKLKLPGVSSGEVKRNIVEKFLPPHVQYACRHWMDHLRQAYMESTDWGKVDIFLRTHFMHWLEALGLLGMVSEGILAIKELEQALPASSAKYDNMRKLVYDGKRFALSNRSIIERFPLQIYCAGLIFAPTESIVRKLFTSSIPRWIKSVPRVPRYWDPALQILEGHSGSVRALIFSPDGKLLASGAWDNTVRVWDVATGESRLTLKSGHLGKVNTLSFSPNGEALASGSDDNTVEFWDVATGESRETIKLGYSGKVVTMAFSPDGKLLAFGSLAKTAWLWDAAAGESRGILEGHSDEIITLAFSPNGKVLASGSRDNTIRLWDIVTGEFRGIFDSSDHPGVVWSLVFSPDGKLLASGFDDETVRIWATETRECLGIFKGHSGSISALVFSPNGKLLASGAVDSIVRVWDTATGESRGTFQGHSHFINTLAFSPDGKLLASGSDDETVRVWDMATVESRGTLEGHSAEVITMAFSLDGKLLASGSGDNTIRISDAATGELSCATLKGHSGDIMALAFSPNGKYLASGSRDNTVRIWDVTTSKLCDILEGHLNNVWTLAYSPDGKLLASGSVDSTVRVWDTASGVCRGTLKGHLDWVRVVAFSPNGNFLASASDDSTVRIWNVGNGDSCATLEGHSGIIWTLAFAPDGKLLASAGSGDNTVRVWEVATGELHGTLEGHLDEIWTLAFSPNGELLASGSEDKTIRVWDVTTSELRDTLEGHWDGVWALAYSPDGKLLASGSYDNTVQFWDAATGEWCGILEGDLRRIHTLGFSFNGKLLVNGTSCFQDQGDMLDLEPPTEVQSGAVTSTREQWGLAAEWILYRQQKLVFLPFKYRSRAIKVNGDWIAWGIENGNICVMQLDPS